MKTSRRFETGLIAKCALLMSCGLLAATGALGQSGGSGAGAVPCMVNYLRVRIATGGDDLRGWDGMSSSKDNLDVTVYFGDKSSQLAPDVNNNSTWKSNTVHLVVIKLNPAVPINEIKGIKLQHTGSGLGFSSAAATGLPGAGIQTADNWDMDWVDVMAEGTGASARVAAHGAKRFTGQDRVLDIRAEIPANSCEAAEGIGRLNPGIRNLQSTNGAGSKYGTQKSAPSTIQPAPRSGSQPIRNNRVLAAQIPATKQSNPAITPVGPHAQQPPGGHPVMTGTIYGFVYWDANLTSHLGPSVCNALAITVAVANKGSYSPFGVVGTQSQLTSMATIHPPLTSVNTTSYDGCAYSFGNAPLAQNLYVTLSLTQPVGTLTPAVVAKNPAVGPIQFSNAPCSKLPPLTKATAGDLTGNWGSCQNVAYDVNLPLVKSAQLTVLSASGASGGNQSGTPGAFAQINPGPQNTPVLVNPGPQQRPMLSQTGVNGTMLNNQSSAGSPSHGMLVPAVKPSPTPAPSNSQPGAPGQLSPAKTGGSGTVQLNPQASPASGTSIGTRGSSPLLPAAELTPATIKRGKTLASHLRLVPGTKIRLSNAPAQGLDPITIQAIQSESLQTHNIKVALAKLKGSSFQGAIHTLDSTDPADPVPGSDPTGGQTGSSGSSSGGASQEPSGTPPTQSSSGSSHFTMQQVERAPQPISMCHFTADPVIETVGGKNRNIVLTPDPGTGKYPNNQYSIVGCNFGAIQGDVHIFGPFINNPSPFKLGIDNWTDSVILVTFSPTFQNEYDLKNITLVVVRKDGKSVQVPGISFVATRASRPLASIPRSLVKLPTDYFQSNQFISPLTYANLQQAGLNPVAQTGTAAFYLYDPIWSSNVGDGYPLNRLSFSDSINFGQLRSGFTLDSTFQTLVLGGPTLDYSSMGPSGCKYVDTVLSASMEGSNLVVDVQPSECDDDGKFISAYYGLILSVTGPKGDSLNPWPDGLQ